MPPRSFPIRLAGNPIPASFAVTLTILAAACSWCWGDDYRWFGGGTSNDWGNVTNWQSGLIPPTAQSSGTTTNVLMSGSGGTSDLADVFNNDDDWELDSLTFESAATGSYNLTGGTITLANVFSSSTKIIRNSDGNTHSFSNAGIDLNNATITFDADTADLDFNTTVNFARNNATLTVMGGNDVFFDGGISAENFVTNASMTISGGTTAHIGGSSSALTQITLSNGTLQLDSNSNLGDAVNISTFSGTTFNVNGFTENIDQITGSGTINLGSGSLTLGDSADFTFSGAITGTGSITKNQSGLLTLSGVSTYSGATNITAGTLRLNNSTTDGSLSSTTDVSVSAGATFDLNGVTDTVDSISGAGTVDLGGGELAVDATTGTAVFSGNFAGTGTLRKLGGHSLTLSGNNQFTSLIVADGTLSVSASSNLGAASATMLLGGNLDVNGSFTNSRSIFLSNGTIDVAAGSTLTQSGTIQNNTGAASLTKTNSGTLVLSGNNSYTGDTIVSGGRLEISTSERINNSSDLLINASGVLDLNNFTETVGGLSGSGGTIDTGGASGRLIVNQSENTSYAGQLLGSGGLTKQGIGTLTLSTSQAYSGSTLIQGGALTLTGSGSLTSLTDVVVSNGATFDLNGISDSVDSISGDGSILLGGASLSVDQTIGTTTFSGTISESGSISKSGGHTLVLSGNNSFTNGVAIFDGILSVGADNNLGAASGAITLAANGTWGTTGSFTTARTLQFGMAANGTIDTAAGTTLTHTGPISGGADVTFRKSGLGTYQLGAANAGFAGNIEINGGTFEIASFSGDALGNSTRITVNSGGTLLNNQVEGFGSLAGSGNVITNSTLEVGFDNTSTTFSGMVSGNVGGGFFGKAGTGIMAITQPLTYAGPTQINGGTLRLSSSGGLPNSSDVLVDATWDLNNLSDTIDALSGAGNVLLGGATLTVGDNNGGGTFSGVISEAGSLVKTGAGTQVLSGLNTYTLVTRIEGGRLQIANSNNLGSGSIQIANGARLQVTGTTANPRSIDLQTGGGTLGVSSGQTLTQSGSLFGIGGFNKADLGTLLLTALPFYGGNTDVQDGTLRLSGSGRIPDGSDVIVRSGATWDLNGVNDTVRTINSLGSIMLGNATLTVNGDSGNTTFGGVISEPGGLVKAGGHSLQLSGTNTFAGPISVLGGTLSVANNTHLGDGGNNLTLDGGTLRTTSGFTMPRAVALGAAGGSFDVASGFLTINQPVSGSGSLNKTGIGNLSLSANNTYSGGTKITQGSVEVFSNAGLGANSGAVTLAAGTLLVTNDFTNFHPVIVSGGGTISVDGATLTHNASITGAGTLTKTGDGILLLTMPASHTGNTVIDEGTLRFGAGGLPDLFDVEVSDPATVWDLNGTSDAIDALIGDGMITLGGATLTLGAADGGDFFEGVIQGPGALVKIGAAEQRLEGTFTHDSTNINGGALRIRNDNTLGAAAAPLGFDGGELHTTATFAIPRDVTLNPFGGTFNVDGATTLTIANPVTGPGGLTKIGAGTLLLQAASNFGGPMSVLDGLLQIETDMTFGGLSGSGNIELGLNELSVHNPGDDIYSGVISGLGGKLTKDGPGTLTLTGINTYTGGTCILDGVLRISQTENLGAEGTLITFDGGALNTTASFNMIRGIALNAGGGTIDVDAGTQLGAAGNVTGIGSMTKIGDGVLSLVGGFSSYEGGTNILAGEVEINNNINLGNTIGQLTLDNGSLHTSNNVSMARLTTLGAGGGTFRTDATTTLTHSGAIVGNPGLAGVTKGGDGDLRWQGNNTFSGDIILEAGRLQVDASGQLGNTANTLLMRGGGLHALATMTNPRAIQLETGTGTNTIEVATGTTLTQAGVISDGAMGPPLPLAKNGLGDLLLTAPNTYSSPTQIDQGTLRLSSAGRLPDVTDVNVAQDSTFDLNGVNDAIDALDGSGDVTLGSGTLTVGADNGGGFFDGVISGNGSLVKTGTGKQILSTWLGDMGQPIPNTYAGGTQVNGGILNIEQDGNLGAPTGPLGLDNGELEVETRGQGGSLNTTRVLTLGQGGGTIDTISMDSSATMNGVISGPGTLTKLGLGTLTLTAPNTYGGDTVLDGGLTRLLNAGRLPDTSRVEVNVASNMTQQQGLDLNNISDAINGLDGNGEVKLGTATLTVGSGGGDGVFSGTILGTGSVAKTGTGTQTLSGNNTYSGGTAFLGGVLEVPLNGSLGDTVGGLTFDGGALRTTGSFNMARLTSLNGGNGTIDTAPGTSLTHNGVISGIGGLSKSGDGTLLVGASNTYTGPTTINAGMLRLTNVERLANATDVTVAAGATFDLNNFNETVDALDGAGTVQLGSASLVVGFNNGTGSFNGVISGTGDLLKEGFGAQTLSGQNTYSGATFIDRGELILNAGGSIDQSTTVVGFNIGSDGIATINGSGTTWDLSGNLVVGLDGTARMNIRNGAVMTVEGDVRIGSNNQGAASAGTLSLAGGTLDNSVGNGIDIINGTLQGHGTILGDIDNFARLAPGNSTGILDVTGNVLQSNLATLAIEVGGRDNSNPQNPQFDVLNVSGNLGLDGLLDVALVGFTPTTTDTFVIASATQLAGVFSNVASGSRVNLSSGGTGSFRVDYGPGSPFNANQIVLSDFQGTGSASGDFNGDGDFDGMDVDSLVAVIAAGSNDPAFDLTGDLLVNTNDLDQWLAIAGAANLPSGNPYLPGDATLDGVVDGQDFIVWNTNKFTNVAAFTAGDFTADGVVDGQDFIRWNTNKFMSSDAGGVFVVPEPGTWGMCLVLLLAVGRIGRFVSQLCPVKDVSTNR